MNYLICMCGMPGSGKTTFAKHFIHQHPNFKYFSPDEYYQHMNGDSRDRSHTFEIWIKMFQDIHGAEEQGLNVLVDSDNLTFAQRMQWIEWFPTFKHILLYLDVNFDICIDRVNHRYRTIPEKTMKNKYSKWENPYYCKDYKYWNMVINITEDV